VQRSWVSAVVEANGAVRPCFFHPPVGNVREAPLDRILREDLPAFRRKLSVATDPLCERCVCSIRFRQGVS
jgi:radical SAM protein with 4Fe4S-binding SPASM domain